MKTSFPKNKIKVLLLENVHDSAVEIFNGEGFLVERVPTALSDDALAAKLAEGVHILGIRSKTQVRERVLKQSKNLLSVGCFCIGVNQVDLHAANTSGIPVFNAPFSNTRSVAEMIIGQIIMLARQIGDRSAEVHQGIWKKISAHCYEVRGKTLGIVGYGHIGSQVGVLAEGLGMRVIFHDIAAKLPMGNVQPRSTLTELLTESDFVTLHVPETPATQGLIGANELKFMKQGSYLLNASRGTVVNIDALAEQLKSKHLAGAAIDVYPEEPEGKTEQFASVLQKLPNVILTPHIGGSTEEAQANIGIEVARAMTKFINQGSTAGTVNFPIIDAPHIAGAHRILNVHKNVPGVLKNINQIVSDLSANIRSQVLSTDNNIGYLVMDLDQNVSDSVKDAIEKLGTSIRTRILY